VGDPSTTVPRLVGVSFADAAISAAPLAIPIRRVMDTHARCSRAHLRRFWLKIWPETFRDFGRAGIRLETTDASGQIRRTAADRPVFTGLERGVLNLVLTDHIPMFWDRGRASAGVTTLWEGYHVCMIAMQYAHTNQVPWISTNTCTHELLHAILGDIFIGHPSWYQGGERELRTDWVATRLWLFPRAADLRGSARAYLARLKS